MEILTIHQTRVFNKFVNTNKLSLKSDFRVIAFSNRNELEVSWAYEKHTRNPKMTKYKFFWEEDRLYMNSALYQGIYRVENENLIIDYQPGDLLVLYGDMFHTILHIPVETADKTLVDKLLGFATATIRV